MSPCLDCRYSWAGRGSFGHESRLFLLGHEGRSSHSRENLNENAWCGGVVGREMGLSSPLPDGDPSEASAALVSSELLGGVTSPGRVFPGVLVNGLILPSRLHRLLPFVGESAGGTEFRREEWLLYGVDWLEFGRLSRSKETNKLAAELLSFRMIIRRRPGAGLQGAVEGYGRSFCSASSFKYW